MSSLQPTFPFLKAVITKLAKTADAVPLLLALAIIPRINGLLGFLGSSKYRKICPGPQAKGFYRHFRTLLVTLCAICNLFHRDSYTYAV